MPALNELASKVYIDTTIYADLVHFVHIYIIEPHPQSPDVSPYSGRVSESVHSSGKSQPRTYNERVANAEGMLTLIHGNQLLLIDDLRLGEKNNIISSNS